MKRSHGPTPDLPQQPSGEKLRYLHLEGVRQNEQLHVGDCTNSRLDLGERCPRKVIAEASALYRKALLGKRLVCAKTPDNRADDIARRLLHRRAAKVGRK